MLPHDLACRLKVGICLWVSLASCCVSVLNPDTVCDSKSCRRLEPIHLCDLIDLIFKIICEDELYVLKSAHDSTILANKDRLLALHLLRERNRYRATSKHAISYPIYVICVFKFESAVSALFWLFIIFCFFIIYYHISTIY